MCFRTRNFIEGVTVFLSSELRHYPVIFTKLVKIMYPHNRNVCHNNPMQNVTSMDDFS